jgi:hypothetical protein
VSTAKIAKIAGILLLVGPLVDLLVSISRPGSFPSDHVEGVQAAMQSGVHSAASNGTFVQLLVDVGFIASFGLLFGFWCVDRFMSSEDGRAHLRKAGLMILGIALAVRLHPSQWVSCWPPLSTLPPLAHWTPDQAWTPP